MKELLRVVEEPRECFYLPGERASLEYRMVADLDPNEYSDLLARGYRRFGYQLYRPACPDCAQCVSIRVLLPEFRLSRGQRRVIRQNASVRVERGPLFVTQRHIEIYRKYHLFMADHRAWTYHDIDLESYCESFIYGGDRVGSQWMFYHGDRLMGVALMDETPDAISLVYQFHDPLWRPQSPGTFAALVQLNYASDKKLRYAYPGYWITANPSMKYKSRFRPFESLTCYPPEDGNPEWVRNIETEPRDSEPEPRHRETDPRA